MLICIVFQTANRIFSSCVVSLYSCVYAYVYVCVPVCILLYCCVLGVSFCVLPNTGEITLYIKHDIYAIDVIGH